MSTTTKEPQIITSTTTQESQVTTTQEPQTMVANALLNKFRHKWHCSVLHSGLDSVTSCTPDEPHPGWGCQYRYEAALTPQQYVDFENRIRVE